MSDHPLDDPLRGSLLGTHAHLAQRHGEAMRYLSDVAPFLSLPPDGGAWADAAVLLGPGGAGTTTGRRSPPPPEGWDVLGDLPGVQLVGEDVDGRPDPEAVILGPGDVPEMTDLVARTRPGPWRNRTIELGIYLGIRHHGALIAMAGERMHPPGWTEISAVCTDPEHRGRGLATRLILDLVARIRDRGEAPLLHAAASNVGAIALYERLGFRLRARPSFMTFRAPSDDRSALTPEGALPHDSPAHA